VRFVIKRDLAIKFRFLVLQSKQGRALAKELDIDPDDPETNALVLAGRAYFKSDAALQVLARLPGWSWVRHVALVPRPLRDWVYDRIAGNRYRLFGRSKNCPILPPEARRHVIEAECRSLALPETANRQRATTQAPQGFDATHGGELFPVNESRRSWRARGLRSVFT
jgi:predicted DCC family thiol-disulfide oxidoreductase YuxK